MKKKQLRPQKSGIAYLQDSGINWFPGHMKKALETIKSHIKMANIIIDVRDARAPMVSGNKEVYYNGGDKPYLIVFNKTNLADPEITKQWSHYLNQQNESFEFINALDKQSLQVLTKRAREILHAHRLKSNPDVSPKQKMTMMVLGLPNTGKSTIINKLANRNATKAASKPGQTMQKLWVKVDKDTEILDTPGVMPPNIQQEIHGMWLAAIHIIPEHIVTADETAAFIIDHMLKTASESFKQYYQFKALPETLLEACDHIAKTRGCMKPGGHYDYDKVYNLVLNDFRKGLLGPTSFEAPPALKKKELS